MTDSGTGQLPAADRADRLHLSSRHREILEALLREHLPGIEVWAYGSRVNGQSHDGSDLDLVLRAPDLQEVPISPLADLTEALHNSTLPFLIEARDWVRLPERFHREIERGYVVIQNDASKDDEDSSSDWRKVTLGDCVVMNESTYSPKESWPFINYLDTGNITDNRVSEIQHLLPSTDKVPSRARRKVRDGDIVYSTVRPNKRHFGLLRETPENCLASTGFAVIRGKKHIADTGFIFWFLTQNHIVEHLHTIAEHSTSAYPSIRPSDIKQLKLHLPPLDEQHAIAHILGTLDDKIELNRRMNETLEAMARALFKSWFVDFDPVRAKMEGRWRPGESLPGLPAHLYDLFPDRLVESELGEVPEGWEISKIGDIASVSSGKRPHTRYPSSSSEAEIPVWGGNGPMAFTTKHLIDYPILITGRVGTLGSVFRVTSPCWPSDNTLILKGRVNQYFEYLFCHMEYIDFSSLNRGSTQPLLTQSDLKKQSIILPSKKFLVRFSDFASHLFHMYDKQKYESETLTILNNMLLPKLVSGKIRIRYKKESDQEVI